MTATCTTLAAALALSVASAAKDDAAGATSYNQYTDKYASGFSKHASGQGSHCNKLMNQYSNDFVKGGAADAADFKKCVDGDAADLQKYVKGQGKYCANKFEENHLARQESINSSQAKT